MGNCLDYGYLLRMSVEDYLKNVILDNFIHVYNEM